MRDRESTQSQFPLQGQRIKLQNFTSEHINDSYLGWLKDPEVVRYSNQRFNQHSAESCRSYLNSFERSDNLFLAMHLKHSGQCIGSMTAYYSRLHDVADIGMMIGDRSYWGQGLGQEAWELLMDHLLRVRKIRKVTGGTLATNIGMVRVMEKSGMQPDGRRIQQQLVDGKPCDILYFASFGEA